VAHCNLHANKQISPASPENHPPPPKVWPSLSHRFVCPRHPTTSNLLSVCLSAYICMFGFNISINARVKCEKNHNKSKDNMAGEWFGGWVVQRKWCRRPSGNGCASQKWHKLCGMCETLHAAFKENKLCCP